MQFQSTQQILEQSSDIYNNGMKQFLVTFSAHVYVQLELH